LLHKNFSGKFGEIHAKCSLLLQKLPAPTSFYGLSNYDVAGQILWGPVFLCERP